MAQSEIGGNHSSIGNGGDAPEETDVRGPEGRA